MATQTFQIWRGQGGQGRFQEYRAEVSEGMVVLDAVHVIQAKQAPDLACRWNCKAGKCGSCSAEINGQPKLMCMTRLNQLPADTPRDVVVKINADIQKVFADADFREKFLDRAMLDPIAGSPEQFAAFIKAEAAKWSKVVKDANLKIE